MYQHVFLQHPHLSLFFSLFNHQYSLVSSDQREDCRGKKKKKQPPTNKHRTRMENLGEAAAVVKPEVKVRYTQLFINGEFVDPVNGGTFETLDPRTGEAIARIAEASKDDVDRAVNAAREAFDHGPWPRLPGITRARILHKLADLVEQHSEELAVLESWDAGKPLQMSRNVDIPCSLEILRYFAGWADKIHGQTCKMEGPFQAYTLQEPIGVVGQIIPWNFPLVMFFYKISPALACGCTVVIKPAEQTPLTALYCAHLSKEAGIPAGALNVITGYGVPTGEAIASHMGIDKVAFTGSTEVGRLILEASAKSNMKPVTLEMGGKCPLIIMDDADLDEAVHLADIGIYSNMGQVCVASSRVFVQEKIYDEFVKKATVLARQRVVGDPFKPGVVHGPQVDKAQYDKVLKYIEYGKQGGAKLETGGNTWGDKGFYIEPTIFSHVKDDMKIAQDEIFGPVMSVLPFKTIEEAIERANNTMYGLGAVVVTRDMDVAIRMSRSLKAGMVWINCPMIIGADTPFGGYKMSGIGRENGSYGLSHYLNVKTVVMPLKDSPWL